MILTFKRIDAAIHFPWLWHIIRTAQSAPSISQSVFGAVNFEVGYAEDALLTVSYGMAKLVIQ